MYASHKARRLGGDVIVSFFILDSLDTCVWTTSPYIGYHFVDFPVFPSFINYSEMAITGISTSAGLHFSNVITTKAITINIPSSSTARVGV